MRNRIETVERLTGRRMESAQDRHELWLALRAREMARTSPDR
jgi:PucR family transcriptional regulator, purine catabolism regulatory protein